MKCGRNKPEEAPFSLEDLGGVSKCLSGKESTCQCRRCRRHGFHSWVRKAPWRRKWQPTPVFLPGESHGWRSLVGYSPRGRKWMKGVNRYKHHISMVTIVNIWKTHSTWFHNVFQRNRFQNQVILVWRWSHSAMSNSLWPHEMYGPHGPGSTIHGIFQARILEWVATFFSRGSSWPRDWTQVSWY